MESHGEFHVFISPWWFHKGMKPGLLFCRISQAAVTLLKFGSLNLPSEAIVQAACRAANDLPQLMSRC